MVNKIPHIIINKINALSYGKYQKKGIKQTFIIKESTLTVEIIAITLL